MRLHISVLVDTVDRRAQTNVGDLTQADLEMILYGTVAEVPNRRLVVATAMWALFLIAISPTFGNSYHPFPPTRYVSSDGGHYVVAVYQCRLNEALVSHPVQPAVFLFVKRRPGRQALKARTIGMRSIWDRSTGGEVFLPRRGAGALFQRGDVLLCRYNSPFPPAAVLVSEDGGEFVIVDQYGPTHFDVSGNPVFPSVVCVGKDGSVRFKLQLSEIFQQGEIDAFQRSVEKLIWLKSASLANESRTLLIVAANNAKIKIDLNTARVWRK